MINLLNTEICNKVSGGNYCIGEIIYNNATIIKIEIISNIAPFKMSDCQDKFGEIYNEKYKDDEDKITGISVKLDNSYK